MKTYELHQFDDGKGIIWRFIAWENESVLEVLESADPCYLSVLRKMVKANHGVILPTRAKLERLFAERLDQWQIQVAHLNGDTWVSGAVPPKTPEQRQMNRHVRYEEQFPRKCGARGDFGHTNIWGTPYLMFDTYCRLPVGHEGKHECRIDVRVAPTSEEAGRAVVRKSVEVSGETLLRWDIDDAATETLRWRNVLDMWSRIGQYLRADLSKK